MRHVVMEFPGEPESVREARAFVGDTLETWGLPAAVEVAVLLTSEVATNAVRHAGGPFEVTVEERTPEVLVKVRDGSARPPTLRVVPVDAENGRGLPMVRILADRWGSTTLAAGKLVWFAVPAR